MKKSLTLLFAIIVVVFFPSCSSYKKYTLTSLEGSLTPITCTIEIPKNYSLEKWDDCPYSLPWQKYYRIYPIDKLNYSDSLVQLIIECKTEDLLNIDIEELKQANPTVSDLKSEIISQGNIISSEDMLSNGFNAFSIHYKRDDFLDAQFIEFFVSNNKQTDNDYFGVLIWGIYKDDEEKEQILSLINSLKILE